MKGYSSQKFFADLVAGITVGIVALPLAMAFAIASGVKPEAGIFTAVIAGFLISAFGGSSVADKLETALQRARQEPEILILRMRKVLAMDATGLNALEDLYDKLQARKKHLILSGPHTQPLFLMDKAGFLDRIGRDNVCAHIDASLERARQILAEKKTH